MMFYQGEPTFDMDSIIFQKGKMQTTIKNVDVEWVGTGAKKYGKAAVKHDNGKGERTQYLVSFKNPDVFKKVQEMVGQTVEVENVKDGEFWTWKSVSTTSSAPSTGAQTGAPASATTRVSGSNYETKEERAARQVLIVKQSSLSAAVATLTPGSKSALDPKTVIETAQAYLDWVFEKPPVGAFDNMDDDIPF